MRSTVERNAQICCNRYDVFNIQRVISARIQNWYNSTITDTFLNEVLVLIGLIFFTDDSFDISGNSAPLYSRDDINLFISLICTSDVCLFIILFIALLTTR